MKTLFILASVTVFLFLATANQVEAQKKPGRVPAASTVGTYLRHLVTSQSAGVLTLGGFQKTNGYAERYGIYVLEWQAQILFEREADLLGHFVGNIFRSYDGDDVFRVYPETGDPRFATHFNKGTTLHLTDDATLRKTEQGWRTEKLTVKMPTAKQGAKKQSK